MTRFIALSLVVLASGGACPPRGESVITVKGELSDARENCQLELFTARDAKRRAFRDIKGRFDTAFTIPARSSDYYFVVKCGDAGRYQSASMNLGPHSGVDLGQIVLRP